MKFLAFITYVRPIHLIIKKGNQWEPLRAQHIQRSVLRSFEWSDSRLVADYLSLNVLFSLIDYIRHWITHFKREKLYPNGKHKYGKNKCFDNGFDQSTQFWLALGERAGPEYQNPVYTLPKRNGTSLSNLVTFNDTQRRTAQAFN